MENTSFIEIPGPKKCLHSKFKDSFIVDGLFNTFNFDAQNNAEGYSLLEEAP